VKIASSKPIRASAAGTKEPALDKHDGQCDLLGVTEPQWEVPPEQISDPGYRHCVQGEGASHT